MKKAIVMALLAALLMSLAICVVAQEKPAVELHGYVQNRFYGNPDSTARFAVERVSLSAIGNLAPDKTAYVEVYYHPWVLDDVLGVAPNQFTAEQGRTYLESAYVDLPLGEGRIRIGKGRHLNFGITPAYPNRKASQYHIVTETFTQDRIQGLQYAYNKGNFDAGASLYTDLRIGNRQIGAIPNGDANKIVRHFAERDDTANISGRLAFSGKLGVSSPCWKAHVSGAFGGLVQDDANFIGNAYGIATTDKTHNKYGLDATYKKGTFIASSEWYKGRFSFLEVTGFTALVGYEPADKMARRAYLRYSTLDNDRAPLANQLTWDNQQWLFALVQPISKGIWAELNYEKNSSSTGGGAADPNNDVLFIELFTGF